MTHLNLVASKLENSGFKATVTKYGVKVSLNRKVNKLEVWTALDSIFEDISFKINNSGDSVLVTE